MTIIRYIFIAVVIINVTACSSLPRFNDPRDNAQSHVQNKHQPAKVFDVRKALNLQAILAELVTKKVILVGESHTSYADHQNQLEVIKALFPHWSKMGIGLEFIQSPYQAILDEYVAGQLTDAQMLKRTHWYQRWRYDFRLYRDIFHYAKKHKIPLVALNAPTELTKQVREKGIAGLDNEQRRMLPPNIQASKAYRDRLLKVYQQHSHTNSREFNHFLDVQLVWDESMAANTVKALESGMIDHMVLLAGSGHVIRQAIPVRLGVPYAIMVNDLPDELEEVDFVLHRANKELPKAGKIGITMALTENKVVVADVLKSHQGGLKKGDQILAVKGIKVMNPEDVKIALLDEPPGKVILITIQQGHDKKMQKRIKLF